MLRPVAVLLVTSALVAGCSGSQDPDPDASPSASGSAASPSGPVAASPSATPGATGTGTGAAETGIDPDNPPEPVATATVAAPVTEDPKAKLDVEVYGLQRRNKLLVMTAAVTPQNTLAEPQALFTLLGNGFWSPTLIDTVNLKQYAVVRGERQLNSSEVNARATSGQRMFLYAVFAAPPPDVTTIDVQFFSSAPALTDVPIR